MQWKLAVTFWNKPCATVKCLLPKKSSSTRCRWFFNSNTRWRTLELCLRINRALTRYVLGRVQQCQLKDFTPSKRRKRVHRTSTVKMTKRNPMIMGLQKLSNLHSTRRSSQSNWNKILWQTRSRQKLKRRKNLWQKKELQLFSSPPRKTTQNPSDQTRILTLNELLMVWCS